LDRDGEKKKERERLRRESSPAQEPRVRRSAVLITQGEGLWLRRDTNC